LHNHPATQTRRKPQKAAARTNPQEVFVISNFSHLLKRKNRNKTANKHKPIQTERL
jgi:hypothetical protein